MENKTFQDCVKSGFLGSWDSVARCTKPTIAAVNGFAVSCRSIFTVPTQILDKTSNTSYLITMSHRCFEKKYQPLVIFGRDCFHK